ncbi:retrovirus-related Pol polyprotein from transposon 412 [Trichonephila clavipes]|nr:retrovirus-related Pol polyprotein from transposon 412 [Trichonephila clavipes]
MPFGLRNAPATFQRLMDQFRNGLPNVNILVYLDDIVVLSETFEQHIEDLRMVFDRLKNLNYVLTEKMQVCLLSREIPWTLDNPKGIEPFIIRTDASSYALGAVLLQGESPTDEQPVEYASRLLSSAEKLLDNRARSLGCSLGLKQI